MSEKIKHFYEFDEFRLDAETPGLWRDGELVPIFPKALDILVLLVDKRGAVVSREELMETVWRDCFVEESNITYTVSLLRKTLDSSDKKRFIQTIPKRGYRFTSDVREVSENGKAVIPAESVPTKPPKAQIRPIFIGIILLGVLLLTSFAVWWNVSGGRGLSGFPVTQRNIRTVAILPLKTLTEGEQSKALALGLTDSLISRLGSLNRFAVRPLNSVKGYAESDQDPLKFGAQLKTDAVLEGTLQTVEGRLRVNVRLWDARDGAQLWQDSFDAAEADFFNLQDAISTKLTQSLVSELLEKDRQLLTKRYTENAEAFRAYIRGRAIFDRKNPGNVEKAIDEYQKAVALDPTFALAYVGFADAFSRLGRSLPLEQGAEVYLKAKAAANKALTLDPELAEAHASLGLIKRFHDWDWDGAESDFKRAIELNPNYANAHLWYAQLLAMRGRGDEALAEIKRTIEIDPLSSDIQAGRLAILESRGEYAEALALAREFADFDKVRPLARRGLATFLFHHGEYLQVIEISEEDLPKYAAQKYVWLSLLATAYHRTGQTEKSVEKLKQLEEAARTDTQALYSLAMNYAELGRADDALAALEKCFELREERMSWIKVEPRFANLRGDTRFQEILRQMKLN